MSLSFERNAAQHGATMPSLREMRKSFGLRLRCARKAAGYETARELAADIEIDESALSNYERGLRRPPNDVLLKLTRRLQVTADYLYFGHTDGLSLSTYAKLSSMPGHELLEGR